LSALTMTDSNPRALDFVRLIERAEDQHRRIEAQRIEVGKRALTAK
jgi:hypothetical protein